jgi:hypothetical protein
VRKKIELREGEEAAERFRELTEKIVSVPKSEIDKRATKECAKRDSAKADDASE